MVAALQKVTEEKKFVIAGTHHLIEDKRYSLNVFHEFLEEKNYVILTAKTKENDPCNIQ
ncbi:MAG: hypothetical protein K940chlam9_01697 [Chlamydiae bacterium]|nr:hypothetical protein [Chlamydiota bacterium]